MLVAMAGWLLVLGLSLSCRASACTALAGAGVVVVVPCMLMRADGCAVSRVIIVNKQNKEKKRKLTRWEDNRVMDCNGS